eukprot:2864815-Lingulodinium_polyedra.AAC.1
MAILDEVLNLLNIVNVGLQMVDDLLQNQLVAATAVPLANGLHMFADCPRLRTTSMRHAATRGERQKLPSWP